MESKAINAWFFCFFFQITALARIDLVMLLPYKIGALFVRTAAASRPFRAFSTKIALSIARRLVHDRLLGGDLIYRHTQDQWTSRYTGHGSLRRKWLSVSGSRRYGQQPTSHRRDRQGREGQLVCFIDWMTEGKHRLCVHVRPHRHGRSFAFERPGIYFRKRWMYSENLRTYMVT